MSDSLGPYEFDKVYLGDCRVLLKDIPDGSVHAIISDCPYGSSNSHLRAQNIKEETEIAGDEEGDWRELMPAVLVESARILDEKESAACFFSEGGGPSLMTNRLSDWMSSHLVFHTTLVWAKGGLGMGWTYRRNHENILVGYRKGSKLRWHDKTGAVPTVVHVPRSQNPVEDGHPTIKPIRLMEFLIRNHTKRGDIVLDMFAGSGSTGVACKKLGRKFVGFELNPKWVDLSNRRIKTENEQGLLF